MADSRAHGCRKYSPFKMVSCLPDYCWTVGNVVVPFDLVAEGQLLENTSNDVNYTSCSAANCESVIPHCYGDEEGTLGGLISGTFGGQCEFKEVKATVNVNGKSSVTQTLVSWMNSKNTVGINVDPTALQVTGGSAKVIAEALKEAKDAFDTNIAAANIPNKELEAALKADAELIGKMSKTAKGIGIVASVTTVATSETPGIEAMKIALEETAQKLLVILGASQFEATLIVVAAKTLELVYTKLQELEAERSESAARCTGNNPANMDVCLDAHGYPTQGYPIPPNLGF